MGTAQVDRSSYGTGETGKRSSAAGIGHSWLKYLLTLVLCAVAMLITMVLPGAKSNPVFLFLVVAVGISAWYGGWHCAILATFLSFFGEFYLIYPSLRVNIVSPVLITRLTAMVVLLVGTCIAFSLLRAAGSRNRELLAREKLARAATEEAMAHQKESQELLERYELVAHEGRDIILFLRHDDGRILEANHAAVLAYGYTREELFALTIHDLRAPETRALTPTQMQEAGNSGILFETVHVRKNGSRFPVEVSSRGAEVGGLQTLISIVRDITARRGVEESRRAQMATLQGILNATSESIWLFEPDGTIVLGNETALRRVKHSAEEVIGGRFQEFVAPELAASRMEYLRRVMESRQPLEVTDKRDGIIFLHHYYPVMDGEGRVTRVAAFSSDITERRRAQVAETESKERLQRVLSFITDGYYALDSEWRFVAANSLAERHFGHPASELIGRNLWELAGTPEENPIHRTYLEAATTGVPRHFETESLLRPGTWWEVHLHPMNCGLEVYFRNISKRKLAEEQRRLSEEKLAKAFATNPAAIIISRLADGTILDVNEACLTMFGCRREEVIETSALRFWPSKAERENTLKELKEKGSIYNRELTLPRNSGKQFVALGSAALLKVGSEDLMLSSWLDITERKLAEQAMLRSEKLASVGRLAATVAHEINNPLASVMNLIYLATNSPNLPESLRANLELADAELRRVAHIARQALGFYRESAAPATTSLNRVLDSTVDLLQGKIRQRRAVIEKQWPGDVQLPCVAGELRQVFSNLIANSLDAIDDGGIIKLRISTHRNGDAGRRWARITVADSGQGVSPQDVRHLFEPFFTTKGTLGTGLGLWVSKQIIDKHGGTIRVHSRTEGVRRGTCVSVVLPLDVAAAAPAHG